MSNVGIIFKSTKGFRIAKHSKDQVVNEGDMFRLSCESQTNHENFESSDWKTCIWERHSDGAACHFVYKNSGTLWNVHHSCEPSIESSLDRKIKYEGSHFSAAGKGNNLCAIIIPKSHRSDTGNWTCTLYQCTHGNDWCKDNTGITAAANIDVWVITWRRIKHIVE